MMAALKELQISVALIFMINVVLFVLETAAEDEDLYRGKVNESIYQHKKFSLLPHQDCGKRKLGGFDGEVSTRVAGGTNARLGEFPWIAKIHIDLVDWSLPDCGASIISKRYLVTSGHCCEIFDKKGMNPVIGVGTIKSILGGDEKNILTEKYIKHPQYDRIPDYGTLNDICLIRLQEPLTFTAYVQPICLPIYTALGEKDINGTEMTIVGYGGVGDDNPELLQKAKLTMYERRSYDAFNRYMGEGKEQRTANDDSGSPLITYDDATKRWFLMGVQQGYLTDRNEKGMWVSTQTKVIPYIKWILNKIEE